MAQVIAISKYGKLQNSHGGVRFFNSGGLKISEEITDEQAEQFCETPDHFTRHAGEPIEAPKKAEPATTAKRVSPGPTPASKASADAQQPSF